ncbi:MAG: kynureninase, partial [Mesorhizobium sp.]
PSTIRFGFTPLYVSYTDVWQAVDVLEDILRTEAWKDQRFAVKEAVT